jgi:pilus assembly protein CpaB
MAQWRWSIVGLVAAGIVAALCAAVLVFVVRSEAGKSNKPAVSPDVTYVVAAKALPAMTRLESDALVTRTVSAKQAPEGYISNPAQVLGKVLVIPLVEGQALSQSCFSPNGSGPQLAANIPSGMRAVTLSLAGDSSLKGLLYPGSRVDVVAAFEVVPPSASKVDRFDVSSVVVQNVEVLAIEEKTVFSTSEAPTSGGGLFGGGAATPVQRQEHQLLLVTLLVDPAQSRALRLAMGRNGTVSLSMRNPMDAGVLTSKLTFVPDLLGFDTSKYAERMTAQWNSDDFYPNKTTSEQPAKGEKPVIMGEPAARMDTPGAKAENPATPHWDVQILRGGVSETQSFDVPPIKSGPAGK